MKKLINPGLISAGVLACVPSIALAQSTVIEQLSPIVVTGVAPESPLQFSTNPKLPRLPLPASDGTDYLKTIPGFAAIRNGGLSSALSRSACAYAFRHGQARSARKIPRFPHESE